MSRHLNVLVVDDHPMTRRGIRDTLLDSPRVAQVAEAGAPTEALLLVNQQRWDVIVLDVGLPGRGGLELLGDLKRQHPAMPVLVLSMHGEEQYAIRALRAGAAGYLTKSAAAEQLLVAVEQVAQGRRFITSTLAERLAMEVVQDPDRPLHARLSDREFQVLVRLGGGRGVSAIADELALSVKTVSGYRTNVLQKLNLSNNADIIQYVLNHRLRE